MSGAYVWTYLVWKLLQNHLGIEGWGLSWSLSVHVHQCSLAMDGLPLPFKWMIGAPGFMVVNHIPINPLKDENILLWKDISQICLVYLVDCTSWLFLACLKHSQNTFASRPLGWITWHRACVRMKRDYLDQLIAGRSEGNGLMGVWSHHRRVKSQVWSYGVGGSICIL